MANKAMTLLAATALLYGARRYFGNWGTTKGESEGPLPGDGLVRQPVLTATEAVWIDCPAEQVWPWLVQMGQDRGGLYTFEKLENLFGLGYHDADRIHPEWQQLAVGDPVRLVPRGWFGIADGIELTVVDIDPTRTIVLRAEESQLPWDIVWSFHLFPHGDDRCRLLVRSRLALRHPGQVAFAELAGPARAFVTRGMLTGIKRRSEQRQSAGADTADVPVDGIAHAVAAPGTGDLRP